jgi:hypothetical protein
VKLSSVRPSPALVIGVAALVIALGGTSYAATKISGSQIKKHSIAGNRLKNNTVTGRQIKESTLGTVPKAKSARTANHATTAGSANHATTAGTANLAGTALVIDRSTVTSFSKLMASDATAQTVTFPGGKITASCPSGAPVMQLAGTAASAGSEAVVITGIDVTHGSFGTADSTFSSSSTDSMVSSPATSGNGQAIITGATSNVTTVIYSYQSAAAGCAFSGTVIASA